MRGLIFSVAAALLAITLALVGSPEPSRAASYLPQFPNCHGPLIANGTLAASCPVISVTAAPYGADPTGVLDSTAAFTSALASGALAVYVPAGHYKVCGALMPSTLYLHLFGDGGASQIIQGNCGSPALSWSHTANVYSEQTITNLYFDATAGNAHTIDTTGAGGVTIRQNYFTNTPAGFDNIFVNGAASVAEHDAHILDNQFYSAVGAPQGNAMMECGALCVDTEFSGNVGNGAFVDAYGLKVAVGASTLTVSRNHPYNVRLGSLYALGCGSCQFFGNTWDNVSAGDVVTLSGVGNSTFSGEQIESINAGKNGITLSNGSQGNNFTNTIFGTAYPAVANFAVNETGSSNYNIFNDGTLSGVNYYTAPIFSFAGANSYSLGFGGINNALPHVANQAALRAYGSTAGNRVRRDSFAAAGDGGEADYVGTPAACPLGGGNGDGGSEVKSANGGCWLLLPPAAGVNWNVFGNVGDSNGATGNGTDNTATAQNAINYCVQTGNKVIIPSLPQGKSFRMASPLFISGGCDLEGTISPYATAFVTTPTQGPGSWVFFDHLNKGIVVGVFDASSQASGVVLARFATRRAQPTPGASWAPLAADFDLYIYGGDGNVEDMLFLNPTRAIHNQGRFFFHNIRGQPFLKGYENDALADISRYDDTHWWGFWSNDTNVLAYQRANLEGFVFGRSDGPQIDGFFVINTKHCISFYNGTNPQATGIVARYQFNNVYCDGTYGGAAIYWDAGLNSTTSGQWSNLTIFGLGGFGASTGNYGFDVESATGQWATIQGLRSSGFADSMFHSVAVTTGSNQFQINNLILDSGSLTTSAAPFVLGASTFVNLSGQPLIGGSLTGTALKTGAGQFTQSALMDESGFQTNIKTGTPIALARYTVAQIASVTCNSANGGQLASVVDFTAIPTYGSTTFVGGGTLQGTVACNGTAWASH